MFVFKPLTYYITIIAEICIYVYVNNQITRSLMFYIVISVSYQSIFSSIRFIKQNILLILRWPLTVVSQRKWQKFDIFTLTFQILK